MATRAVYFRGTLSTPDLVDQLAGNKEFLADAKAILALDKAAFDALVEALSKCDSFLDRKGLKSVVEGSLGRGKSASDVFDVVRLLSRMLREPGDPIEQTMRKFRSAIKEHSDDIPEDDREKLGERLEKLILAPKGLGLQWKADQLRKTTGIELEDIQVICDIRPVFDDARSTIMGAIPISTLKLDVIDRDGAPRSIEIRLTEKQLAEFASKTELAQQKVRVIRQTLAEKSIPLPNSARTTE